MSENDATDINQRMNDVLDNIIKEKNKLVKILYAVISVLAIFCLGMYTTVVKTQSELQAMQKGIMMQVEINRATLSKTQENVDGIKERVIIIETKTQGKISQHGDNEES